MPLDQVMKFHQSYRIAVCQFPGNNSTHPAAAGWVTKTALEMSKDKRVSEIIPLRRSATPVDVSRNLMVKTALAMNADYILMIDSDMEPDCELDGKPFWSTTWDFMMERRKDEEAYRVVLKGLENDKRSAENGGDFISCQSLSEKSEKEMFKNFPPATVGAPYCGAPPTERVMVMRWTKPENDTADPCFKIDTFDRDASSIYSGIWEVAALPTGLILYDARVFKHLPPPWFAYRYDDPPFNTRLSHTEDIFQTVNASILGMPQYCNWDAWAGHWKLKRVGKPRPITVDIVPEQIAAACRTGYSSDTKVKWVRSVDQMLADFGVNVVDSYPG